MYKQNVASTSTEKFKIHNDCGKMKKNNIGWRNICIYEKIYHRNKLEGFIHNNYDNKIPGKK